MKVIERMRSAIHPFNDLVSFIQLCKAILTFRPNIIHAHSTKAGMLSRLGGMLLGVPVVYTVHGWGWRGFAGFKKRLIWWIEATLAKLRNAYYIYVSSAVEADAPRDFGIDRSRVIVNGTADFGVYPEPEGNFVLFMPARVCDAKDHETLIRAFERLPGEPRLLLCGHGTDAAIFRTRAEQWAPNSFRRIEFLGPREDVAALLRRSHVFLLISHFEALPISIIEAMSAGKAIVATRVGGVEDLLENGLAGLLVEPANIDGVVQAVRRIESEQVRLALRKEARRAFEERYTSQRMCDQTLAFYQEILRQNYEN